MALAAAGCDKDLGLSSKGIQSLQVTMVTPTADQLGSPGSPITPSQVTFNVQAIGPDDNVVAQNDDGSPSAFDVDVYLSFSGNKVGFVSDCGVIASTTACAQDSDCQLGTVCRDAACVAAPLATIHLSAGATTAPQTVQLVRAFGTANLWLEELGTHALGTSPSIYFPQPTIADVQTPLDPTSPTASYCSSWNGRHAIFDHATPPSGQLVVTSVFADQYVVADTGAMYDTMKKTGGFNHLDVYTFSAPDSTIFPGVIIKNMSGNLAKFNGFTELNFPLQQAACDTTSADCQATPIPHTCCQTAPLPAIYPLGVMDQGNTPGLLPMAGATVTLTGAICPIDMDPNTSNGQQWVKYNSFLIDMGDQVCDGFMGSFSIQLPAKTLGKFNPLSIMEVPNMIAMPQAITVTGMLQNSSGQNDACKGTATAIQVLCRSAADCGAYATAHQSTLDPMCVANLQKSSVACVEGTCRRGVFNFWNVVPRTESDICLPTGSDCSASTIACCSGNCQMTGQMGTCK
jgi:hypothetical protein